VGQEEGELVVIQVAARVDALYEFCQGYTKPLEQLLALVDNQLLLHKVKILGVKVEEEEEGDSRQCIRNSKGSSITINSSSSSPTSSSS
jgi:hypothetical protein